MVGAMDGAFGTSGGTLASTRLVLTCLYTPLSHCIWARLAYWSDTHKCHQGLAWYSGLSSIQHIRARSATYKTAHSRLTPLHSKYDPAALLHSYKPCPQRLDALTRFTHVLMRARGASIRALVSGPGRLTELTHMAPTKTGDAHARVKSW